MNRVWRLSFLLLGVCALAKARNGEVTTTLSLDFAMGWGDWGAKEFCPTGTFAYAFQIKVESPIDGDDTAMNGIELRCRPPSQTSHEAHPSKITSSVQKWGTWEGVRTCSSGFLTGLRMKSEGTQHKGDDTAANDVEMRCAWSTESHSGGGTNWGMWSRWENCQKNWAICGVETRVEAEQGSGDDTALNNIRMYCCKL